MVSSPGFGYSASHLSPIQTLLTEIKIGFPTPPHHKMIKLATDENSPAHSPKGTRSSCKQDSLCLLANGFRFYFTPFPGFFSPFPHGTMRYRSVRVFSLRGMVPLDSHKICPRGTQEFSLVVIDFQIQDFHLLW